MDTSTPPLGGATKMVMVTLPSKRETPENYLRYPKSIVILPGLHEVVPLPKTALRG
jgi:hypothetical protein